MLAVIQPFDPAGIVWAAMLNPVVFLVAAWLGWKSDQWQKVLVAGFGAALAGVFAMWFVTAAGLLSVTGYGGFAGVFAAAFIWGMVVAAVARFLRKRV